MKRFEALAIADYRSPRNATRSIGLMEIAPYCL